MRRLVPLPLFHSTRSLLRGRQLICESESNTNSHHFRRHVSNTHTPPIIRIDNATFYRRQPPPPGSLSSDATNPPLFPDLTFSLPSTTTTTTTSTSTSNDTSTQAPLQHWAIVGPSNAGKTTFFELLRGQHLCFPPTARSYPYLSTAAIAAKDPRLRYSGNAIQYVGFDNRSARGLSGMGTYMSARYESRREATDFSVRDYLQGRTQLNASEPQADEAISAAALLKVVEDLHLHQLLDMPVSNLSNGQTRRARIAKALLSRPEVMLLDEPFMGLDPPTTLALADLLGNMAARSDPRVVLALRPQDKIPAWITHLMFLGEDLRITNVGKKEDVGREVVAFSKVDTAARSYLDFAKSLTEQGFFGEETKDPRKDKGWGVDEPKHGEAIIEMDGVVVKYGDKIVLGKGRQVVQGNEHEKDGLWWTVKRGQRWGVFGPNGSGKTTLISLLTSDHPQSYALPIKLFSRSRLPSPGKPGIPLFELQRRIGHSSPEMHSFFPRHLSVRASLESAFADTPLSRPTTLTAAADDRISAFLRWFQGELNPVLGPNKILLAETTQLQRRERLPHSNPGKHDKWREEYNKYWYEYAEEREREVEWADTMTFRELSFSAQRILLFLRAIVAKPDVIVLDESFSGLDETIREKCLLFLQAGEGAIIRRMESYGRETLASAESGAQVAEVEEVRVDGEGEEEGKGKHEDELLDEKGEIGTSATSPSPSSSSSLIWKATNRLHINLRDATFFGIENDQALIVVSHVKEEIPASVRNWIFLPDANTDAKVKIGRIEERPLRVDSKMWDAIWGMGRLARGRPRRVWAG